MHTKDMLADALLTVGLIDMSFKARSGFYHDFLSPLDLPEMQLINDLGVAMQNSPDKKDQIMALRARVIDGDFDASAEESEAWAQSPEGQETFKKLTKGK